MRLRHGYEGWNDGMAILVMAYACCVLLIRVHAVQVLEAGFVFVLVTLLYRDSTCIEQSLGAFLVRHGWRPLALG